MKSSLRLKKITRKNDYLLTELEETEFLFNEYSKIFYQDIPSQQPKLNIPVPEPEIVVDSVQPEPEPEPEPQKEPEPELPKETKTETEKEREVINDSIKTIYKKLSLLIHPDRKGGSAEEFKELNKYYKEKDINKIILLASNIGIDVEKLLSETGGSINWDQLENENNELLHKIETIKKTLAWVYYHSDDQQKQIIVNHFSNPVL